jgi:hypothetical protein
MQELPTTEKEGGESRLHIDLKTRSKGFSRGDKFLKTNAWFSWNLEKEEAFIFNVASTATCYGDEEDERCSANG